MFLAYLNASSKVDAQLDELQACMNYHFSFRAFSDQDQHIETIYSSKLS
jgi:hypothetical protein